MELYKGKPTAVCSNNYDTYPTILQALEFNEWLNKQTGKPIDCKTRPGVIRNQPPNS